MSNFSFYPNSLKLFLPPHSLKHVALKHQLRETGSERTGSYSEMAGIWIYIYAKNRRVAVFSWRTLSILLSERTGSFLFHLYAKIGGLLYFNSVLSLSCYLKEQAHSYSIYLQRLEGCCILTAYALYPAI